MIESYNPSGFLAIVSRPSTCPSLLCKFLCSTCCWCFNPKFPISFWWWTPYFSIFVGFGKQFKSVKSPCPQHVLKTLKPIPPGTPKCQVATAPAHRAVSWRTANEPRRGKSGSGCRGSARPSAPRGGLSCEWVPVWWWLLGGSSYLVSGLVINGIIRVNSLKIVVITHLLGGMSHQVGLTMGLVKLVDKI